MRLEPGVPVETTVSTLVVDAGLAVGTHRIRLVVEDDRGRRSLPAEITIEITPRAGGPRRSG